MGKLIDADTLLDVLKNKYSDIVAGAYPFNVVVYDLVRIIENQPALPAGPKWISVGDRLPEEEKEVLCCFCNSMRKEMAVSFVRNGEWYFEGWNPHVTHWMPLPEPPKEE